MLFGPTTRRVALGCALFLSAALAQGTCSASERKYVTIPNFVEPKACVPSGYYQSQDLGNTNPSDLVSRCEAQCSATSNCAAYVGQLFKAADSNLYSGQCFYYSTVPSAPVTCADHPTIMMAEQKDTARGCFATTSTAAASAFCSSYLSIGTVTVYTSTFTPSASTTTSTTTTTTALTSTATTTSTTTSTTSTSTTTSTSISSSTSFTTVTSTLQTTTSTTSFTTTSLTVTEATTTTGPTTTTAVIYITPGAAKRGIFARAVATPSCVPSYEPAASLTSACSCLSLRSATVYRVSTAATKTQTLTSKSTSVSTSTNVSTSVSTSIYLTISTSTSFTTTTTTKTSALATSVTSVSIISVASTVTNTATTTTTSLVSSPTTVITGTFSKVFSGNGCVYNSYTHYDLLQNQPDFATARRSCVNLCINYGNDCKFFFAYQDTQYPYYWCLSDNQVYNPSYIQCNIPFSGTNEAYNKISVV